MRAIIAVLDSFGVGAAPDAAAFGDAGANTLGHIAAACAAGKADRDGVRQGPLHLPNLSRLGLADLGCAAAGEAIALERPARVIGRHGYAAEQSRGKDTPSGHWEMMGLPVRFDWGYFPRTVPCFPKSLIDDLVREAGLPGVLGECHASGTEIIAALGEQHIKTGKPIVYTSADSVLQIAAHEVEFGLERLYHVCEIARKLVDPLNIGRVIARPFVGDNPANFKRTGHRRDLATPPHAPTLLDLYQRQGGEVIAIGKVGDIFAYRGIGRSLKADGNDMVFDTLLDEVATGGKDAIIFANFCDFDTLYGHRRDVIGYAAALEAFDRRLPALLDSLRNDDILVLTADHGCDPSLPGSDHSREYVPILCYGSAAKPGSIGRRDSFADIGQSLASHLGLAPLAEGVGFL